MKKLLAAVAVVVALAVGAPAQAQVSLDLKLAYAVPSGNLVTGGAMSDVWSGALPIEVAGRYRFTPNLSAGLYFQYAPGFINSGCSAAGVSCSGYDMRFGLEAVYGFMPDGKVNPWVSLGTGWEWTRFSGSAADGSGGVTFSGWEYFNVQVGADFPVAKAFAIGPYVGFFGGSYSYASASGSVTTGASPAMKAAATVGGTSASASGSIDSAFRTFHGWWQFGLKGTLNL
ncbi:MAG: hypothetical protein WCK73_01145 [Deltaproteobacteria bacterium]